MLEKKRFLSCLVAFIILVILPACNLPTTGVPCFVPALIKAIHSANADPDLDVLELATDCTYMLTEVDNTASFTIEGLIFEYGENGLPMITTPIIINGNNATIIRAIDAPDFRIFYITQTGILTINNLSLINGFADASMGDGTGSTFHGSGGAIYNDGGYLTINSSNLEANYAGALGGAIFSTRNTSTYINGSTIHDNSAPRGGGILLYGGGRLAVDSSEIFYNSASANGGGINLGYGAELVVTNSHIASNHSGQHGGGIFKDGGADRLPTTITNTTFQDNTADWSGGGVFIWRTPLSISNTDFIENHAGEYGGGLGYQNNSTETVQIRNTTFEGNIALLDGGGIHFSGESMEINGSVFKDNQAENGGGIHNGEVGNPSYINRADSAMVITESIFQRNNADINGGGMHNTGDTQIQDSTFVGNEAGFDGGGFNTYSDADITGSTFVGNSSTRGGGLASIGGDVQLLNNTFSENSASDSGGGIFNMGLVIGDSSSGGGMLASHITVAANGALNGGGIAASGGMLEIKNSIVAYSDSGSDCHSGGGDFLGVSKNLDTDGSCAGFTITDDPRLHDLADYGGPTHTHALKAGSPVIDAAPDCTTIGGTPVLVDQRGQPRPGGLQCDLGAYEDEAGGPPREPTDTPTPTYTPTTVPPAPIEPRGTANQNATCRFGPGRVYSEVDYLLEGETALITAVTQDGTWVEIEGPNWGKLCWIWVELLDIEGDTDQAPVKTPPPTPTFTPTPTSTPTPEPKGCWWQNPNMNQAECKVPCPNDQYSGGSCNP